jgi:hypothetical protein
VTAVDRSARRADEGRLLLPEGTRLVHIGPPKTGTTTLQAAFHAKRAEALAQGVRYAGRTRHSARAVQAVTGRPAFDRDAGSPPIGAWLALVDEVRRAREARVVISSEFFADAAPAAIPRIVNDLDRARVHVVVTLRPLARIIPSQWQQYVQSGMRIGFEEFLDGAFNHPDRITPTFWRRHRHDALVANWVAATSPEQVTVAVVDERDHDHVLRVFEALAGLQEGTLVADEELVNRSLTLAETEAVRAFNIALKDAGLGSALQHRVIHFGAAAFMKERRPGSGEPRVELPPWALERAAAVAREMVDAIAASGVNVVGDLERLAPPARPVGHEPEGVGPPEGAVSPEVLVPPEVAARMAMGVLIVGGLARGITLPGDRTPAKPLSGSTWTEPLELARYSTVHLVGAILGRARQAMVRPVEALRRRLGR